MPSLQVEFRGNSQNLDATLSRVHQSTLNVARGISRSFVSMAAGAAGVYGLNSAIQKTVQTADELVTASRRLGIGIEQLQIVREAAKENNVEFDRFATILEKVNVARAKALGHYPGEKPGMQQASQQAFKALGVDQSMLKSQTAAELVMGAISQKIKSTNTEQLSGDLAAIFGRGFGDAIPLLKTDFDSVGEKMRSIGAIMDSTTAIELNTFKDEMGLIGQIICVQVAPYLVKLADTLFSVLSVLGTVGTYYGTLVAGLMSKEFDIKHPIKSLKAINSEAAIEGREYQDRQDKIRAAFKARMLEIANDLNNPKPANFSGGTDETTKVSKEKTAKVDLTENQKIGAWAAPMQAASLEVARSQLGETKQSNSFLSRILSILGFGPKESLDAMLKMKEPSPLSGFDPEKQRLRDEQYAANTKRNAETTERLKIAPVAGAFSMPMQTAPLEIARNQLAATNKTNSLLEKIFGKPGFGLDGKLDAMLTDRINGPF